MKSIQPFKALHYDFDKINISNILCPPYDVIDENLSKTLTKRSKYNSIFLSYNINQKEGEKKYQEIPKLMKKWKSQKILVKDAKPGFYFLEEKFKWKGKTKVRSGVFALIPVLDNKNVIPHEKIFLDAVTDRLTLLKTSKTHISPIFLIYEDIQRKFSKWLTAHAKKTSKQFQYKNDSIQYRFGMVQDKNSITQLQQIFKNQLLLIADGHHRFSTAQLYSEQTRKEQYILAFIAPSSGVIFSHHEILSHILGTKKVNTKQILKACKTGQLLPQKTTYFYPKVMTGIVMSPL